MIQDLAQTSLQGLVASFSLDALVTGAARLRPDRLAIDNRDAGLSLSFATLDRAVSLRAARLRGLHLSPGRRLLIVGDTSAATWITLLAGLRAGMDVAVVAAHLPMCELAELAQEARAGVLAGPVHCGVLLPVDKMFQAAERTQDLRFVCTFGGEGVDGAVDLEDSSDLPADHFHDSMICPAPSVWTFRRASSGARFVEHSQTMLITAALNFLQRGRVLVGAPILSTLAPIGFAALIAGPVAALLSGAALHLHGPFRAAAFVRALDELAQRDAPVHLIAPAAIAPDLEAAGLTGTPPLASLVLASRQGDPLRHIRAQAPVVDLICMDDVAAIVAPRDGYVLPGPVSVRAHQCPYRDHGDAR